MIFSSLQVICHEVSVSEQGSHLIDEHDGENGLVEVLGFPAGRRRETGGLPRTPGSTRLEPCGNSDVGQSSIDKHLREALDSLQNDIELSSLAGPDGNPCGLQDKETLFI